MGLFDFLFGDGKQHAQPQQTNSSNNVVHPFVFVSKQHQRYENGQPVKGLQDCIRTVRLEKNTSGCKGYRLEPGRGYIVKIWNDDLNKPNMSDKPMDLVRQSADKLEFRGFPIEAQSPFGWTEVDYRDYGFIVFLKNGEVEKCQLHMYDRNTFIEYLKGDERQEENIEQNTDEAKAWKAFVNKNYFVLEQYGANVYNYYVHHPLDLLKPENPLLVGRVFHVCLGFNEPDTDIQEVRAENAFLCFSQAILSSSVSVHDEAAARMLMLLIQYQNFLKDKVAEACRNEDASPLDVMYMIGDDMPADMPIATNTRMLYAAYYLYNEINNEASVIEGFVKSNESISYKNIVNHIVTNCAQLHNSTSERKIELGKIIYDKVKEKLESDIRRYSAMR